MRLGAEHALESLYRNRAKAHANQDTLADMTLAAWRWDALGMKAEFTQEINKFYWDAFLNPADAERVGNDLEEITSINARLEDLRDATTRLSRDVPRSLAAGIRPVLARQRFGPLRRLWLANSRKKSSPFARPAANTMRPRL